MMLSDVLSYVEESHDYVITEEARSLLSEAATLLRRAIVAEDGS